MVTNDDYVYMLNSTFDYTTLAIHVLKNNYTENVYKYHVAK